MRKKYYHITELGLLKSVSPSYPDYYTDKNNDVFKCVSGENFLLIGRAMSETSFLEAVDEKNLYNEHWA